MDWACNHDKPKVLWEIVLPGIATIKVTDEDVESMIIGAFEGGSNYWIDRARIFNPLSGRPEDTPGSIWATFALLNDGIVFIYEQDEDGTFGSPDPYGQTMLTLSMVERGFRMFFEDRANQNALLKYLESTGKRGVWNVEMGEVDAGDADGILQFALWGDWIYG